MKTVKLLLGNSEGRLNKVIETLVRDACRDAAVLHTTRVDRLAEFIRLGSTERFDLAIVMPDHLHADLTPNGSPGPAAEAARAISAVRAQRSLPFIAFTVGGQYEAILREAGAEYVLEIPFKCDEVKAVVQRLMPLYGPERADSPAKWSWMDALKRRLGLSHT
jgi:hypothetical protein